MDIFAYVHASRLAPDLPIPILKLESETMNPGMAANVARNLESLGCSVTLVSNENWSEVTKTRFMDTRTNHAFVRIDKNDVIQPIESLGDLDPYDAIVVSDYDKGFLTESLVASIAESHPRVFLDTKKVIGPFAQEVEAIKMNEFEFDKSRANMTDSLLAKTVITLGKGGAVFQGKQFPVESIEVGDASGAGDTFLSQLVYSRLAGLSMDMSIEKANAAARSVVAHRGVTVISG
jgi:D-glycero-beta-D-manno-heptose-7-phosphate kinase